MAKRDFHYRIYLAAELERRRARNPHYSLRAFAKALRMDPTALSRVLRGKGRLSHQSALKIARLLALGGDARESFLRSVLAEQEQRLLARVPSSPWQAESDPAQAFDWSRFAEGEIGWYYLVLLELAAVEGFRSDPAWIARRLRVPVPKIRRAITRLIECGLLTREESGRLVPTPDLCPPPESMRGSPVDIRYQSLMLMKARAELQRRPQETFARGTSLTVDPKYLPQIRELVHEFVLKLRAYGDSIPKKRVYHCVVGVFPMDTP